MKTRKKSFMREVVSDLSAAGIILFIVFFLGLLLGAALVFLMIIGSGLALAGSIAFTLMIPGFLVVGYLLNRWFSRTVAGSRRRISEPFKERSVHPAEYTSRYRNRFLLQRFTTLGLMIAVFTISTILLGILLASSDLCCICLPVTFPVLMVSVTVPAVGWVLFAYAFDPYEPEPRAFLVIAMTWGMLSTFPSLFINSFNATWMGDLGLDVSLVSAPIFEELFKALGFVLVISQIKDETDGVIYGASIGAGFSLLENLFYGTISIIEGDGALVILLVLFRSFFNIVGHMLGPAAIGFLIGWVKTIHDRKKQSEKAMYLMGLVGVVTFGYVFGMTVHAAWNFFAGLEGWWVLLLFPYGFFQLFLFVMMVLTAFFLGTRRYRKRLREYDGMASV
ncbi:MAG: PrsW family intramembrane metalloprotease [Thermoplasmatota archaeon]